MQSTSAGKQQFAVRLPLTSDDAKLSPAAVQAPFTNDAGEKLYVLPGQTLKVGQALEISANYIVRLPQSPKPKTAYDYILPVAIGLLAVAVVALLVLFLRSRPETDDEEDPDDE